MKEFAFITFIALSVPIGLVGFVVFMAFCEYMNQKYAGLFATIMISTIVVVWIASGLAFWLWS